MQIYHKLTYRYNVIPIKFPQDFFLELHELNLSCITTIIPEKEK